jgi:hypothetical protein
MCFIAANQYFKKLEEKQPSVEILFILGCRDGRQNLFPKNNPMLKVGN